MIKNENSAAFTDAIRPGYTGKTITEGNRKRATVLAFALIPLSGLATDIYLPSFPNMALYFKVNASSIQYTIICFLLSYGIAQLFVGSIIDSFGRYRINLISLLIFASSSFAIIYTSDIHILYLMRVVQGITTAFIVVGKRAFFVDVYTGEKRRHYTSLLSIVWATAPILAPFFGGYLQKSFGWQSNFVVLGMYALVMFVLELIYSGESIKVKHHFHPKAIFNVYRTLLSSLDFTFGIVVLGVSFGTLMIFSMSAPFIVEHQFHLSPVATGYCALLSGLSIFIGGIIGKMIKAGTLSERLIMANVIQLILIGLMYFLTAVYTSLPFLMTFVVLIHMIGGIIYNLFFTYCLTRFPLNAGVASGLTSGGSYLVTSFVTSLLFGITTIIDQSSLAIGYLILGLLTTALLIFLRKRLSY
jgi:predicted MFS family arabinose efflux permease